ncbi:MULTISPECIES: molybdopterin-dependent oxidoreductase [Paraburkholderia]|uniref:molybdopterin-dependent oxidoreductase n=1 Tax=Paraburkholderia TaxID=1822464 RepID=UPI0022525992|nr:MULTISPECIES: molybdopterin-dependent oxidoreductase [Paraburkholderia]MCX4165022.1 molybdopterin-dependent oxidoreductase [Paraburkholderia megapolitana]MDN7160515.1 molybdopterin-dependent oxidoreductase [Paraburkholderia sp. CHISQ3]MDQ6497562.1 molybdopterin-dependent oxidoreductase [Paraburkholderia megapolitana]
MNDRHNLSAGRPDDTDVAPIETPRAAKPERIVLADHRPQLERLQRRLFLRSTLSVGALAMLSGCNMQDGDSVDKVLWAMSRWNDRVQAWLFSGTKLAPTYAASQITKPFPFNAFYQEFDVPEIDGASYALEVSGLVANKRSWSLAQLRTLPQASQITRHVCIEGWSAIGEWRGVPFRTFLERIGADTTARYVGFKCADRYYSSLDMATALHPQTQLTLDFGSEPLPPKYGYPLKLRVPTKLGFKNPKHIAEIFVTNTNPGGYWEDQGYNWFSGL